MVRRLLPLALVRPLAGARPAGRRRGDLPRALGRHADRDRRPVRDEPRTRSPAANRLDPAGTLVAGTTLVDPGRRGRRPTASGSGTRSAGSPRGSGRASRRWRPRTASTRPASSSRARRCGSPAGDRGGACRWPSRSCPRRRRATACGSATASARSPRASGRASPRSRPRTGIDPADILFAGMTLRVPGGARPRRSAVESRAAGSRTTRCAR